MRLIQKFTPECQVKCKARQKAKYRDFITVVLIINKRTYSRITGYTSTTLISSLQNPNFKNWSPLWPDQENLFGFIFLFEGDGLWNMPDQELIALGKRNYRN